jgi:hypothetical protein
MKLDGQVMQYNGKQTKIKTSFYICNEPEKLLKPNET